MTVKLKVKQSPQRSESVPHNRKFSEKKRPEWDGTINDLAQHKLTPVESRKKCIITNAYTPTSIPAPSSTDESGWPVSAPIPTRNHTRTLSQDSDLLPISEQSRSTGHRVLARTPTQRIRFLPTVSGHYEAHSNSHDVLYQAAMRKLDSVASDELADSAALTILNLSFRIQEIQHQLIIESDMRRRLDIQVQQHADQMKKISQAMDQILAGQSITYDNKS